MSIDDKSVVVDSKVLFPRNFDLNLPHLISNSCPTFIQIVVYILNIHYYEFGQPISTQDGFETVFPICGFIDLKLLHGPYIDNMHEFRYFVD